MVIQNQWLNTDLRNVSKGIFSYDSIGLVSLRKLPISKLIFTRQPLLKRQQILFLITIGKLESDI